MKLTLKLCGLMLGLVFVGWQVTKGMEKESAAQKFAREKREVARQEEEKARQAAEDEFRKDTEEARKTGDQEALRKARRAVESRRIKTAQEALDFDLEGRGKMARVVTGPEVPVSIFDVGVLESAQAIAIPQMLLVQVGIPPQITFVNWDEDTTHHATHGLVWGGTAIQSTATRIAQPTISPHLEFFSANLPFSKQVSECAAAELQLALVITLPGIYERTLPEAPSVLLFKNHKTVFNICIRNALTLIQNLLDQSGDYSSQSVQHILTEHMFNILDVANKISQKRAVVVADEATGIAADGPRDISPKEKSSFAARAFIAPIGYESKKIYEGIAPVQWDGQEVMRYSFEHAILELTRYFVFEYIYRFFCDREHYSDSFIEDQAFVNRYLFTGGLTPIDLKSENFQK